MKHKVQWWVWLILAFALAFVIVPLFLLGLIPIDRPDYTEDEVEAMVQSQLFTKDFVDERLGFAGFVGTYQGGGKWSGSIRGVHYIYAYNLRGNSFIDRKVFRTIYWNFYEKSQVVQVTHVD